MEVLFGKLFKHEMRHFPDEDIAKIREFVRHVKCYGFDGLAGRNKPSHEVSPDDREWLSKVKYAQQYKLWHYHIGIPYYECGSEYGNKTSQYVLHYIKGENEIKIVDFSSHPPFRLPTKDYLS